MQCLTTAFNPKNEEHVATKRNIEVGNGLPGIRTTAEVDAALAKAGFEVRFPWRPAHHAWDPMSSRASERLRNGHVNSCALCMFQWTPWQGGE